MERDVESVQLDQNGAQPEAGVVSLDRYDVIGLALLMFGWWRLLSGSWLVALFAISVGWLLAFVDGERRDSTTRLIGGISSDSAAIIQTSIKKLSDYIAAKRQPSAPGTPDDH